MVDKEIEKLERETKYKYVYLFLSTQKTEILNEFSPSAISSIKKALDFDNPYWQQIEKIYQQAKDQKPSSLQGKRQIFHLLSAFVVLMTESVLSFGPLPHPGVSSGGGLETISSFSGQNHEEAFDYILTWLQGEQRYQLQKYGTSFSDQATIKSLDEDNPLWEELQMRYHRAGILGLENPNGRQSLAKTAALTVAIAAATVRNFGEL